MARVIHFEIPVDDPERAQAFYRGVLGWEISNWGGPADYWLATTGPQDEPGINGALTRRSETSAWIHVGVDSVDEALGKIEAAGGAALTQKMPIPAWDTWRTAPTPRATRSVCTRTIPRRPEPCASASASRTSATSAR